MKIEYRINRSVVGKLKNPTATDWVRFNALWDTSVSTPRELLKEIYRGYAVVPVFTKRRTKENFVCAWHFGLDFDANSLSEISQIPHIAAFAAFGYSTPSHTPANPRSRVIFVYDQAITSIEQHEKIIRAFMWLVQAESGIVLDESCKDGLRLFYGSPKCQVWVNPCETCHRWFGSEWAILPVELAMDIVEKYESHQAKTPAIPAQNIELGRVANSRLENYVRATFAGYCRNMAAVREGFRNRELNKYAYTAAALMNSPWCPAGLLNERIISDALLSAALTAGLTEREALATIKSALRSGMSAPALPMPTDSVFIPSALDVL